jgi:hypothetical protein
MSIKTNIGSIPHKPPFEFIQIKIEWKDEIGTGGKNFNDVFEMANFLRNNPAFAEALKYVPTENRTGRK